MTNANDSGASSRASSSLPASDEASAGSSASVEGHHLQQAEERDGLSFEITPAMVRAGIDALIATIGSDRYQGHDSYVVSRIFLAMLQARSLESHR